MNFYSLYCLILFQRDVLRKQIDMELDVVAEVQYMLATIGKPNFNTYVRDMEEAMEAKQRLTARVGVMRDLVSHGKNVSEGAIAPETIKIFAFYFICAL